MRDGFSDTEFRNRAKKVREIAQSVFDKDERQIVLKFVSDSEKLVETARKETPGRLIL